MRTKRNRAKLVRRARRRGEWRIAHNIRMREDVFLRWCTRTERREYEAIR